MHYFLKFILLLWISSNKFTNGLIDIQSIYDDLENESQTCNNDKCSIRSEDSLLIYGCHCSESCVTFDTCCLDSNYIQVVRPKLKPPCRRIYNNIKYYFMVDSCPTSDSIWEGQCREELSHGDDDILKIVPITSLLTSITYKNFFCFRCHETNDEFLYWKIKLHTEVNEDKLIEEFKSDFEEKHYSLTNEDGAWIASFRNDSVRFPLRLSFEIPEAVQTFVKRCDPHIIMNCSAKWTDSEMKEKCKAYMSVREVIRNYKTYIYRNMHCALCNFEDFDDITCKTRGSGGVIIDEEDVPKTLFSFVHLLDINRSDGDKVGKIQKCDNDHVWDSYAERCRKLTCALPGFKIRNGKCKPR